MTPDRHGIIARKFLILLELSSSSGVNRTPIGGHMLAPIHNGRLAGVRAFRGVESWKLQH
jgi:hypothetical protein